MNDERLMMVLLGPHISEKSSSLAEQKSKQIVFKVLPNAKSAEVKAAVEKIFKVEVDDVRILNVKGKKKRGGKQKDWKKAYVALKEGHDINFSDEIKA